MPYRDDEDLFQDIHSGMYVCGGCDVYLFVCVCVWWLNVAAAGSCWCVTSSFSPINNDQPLFAHTLSCSS